MLTAKQRKLVAKDEHPFKENLATQPVKEHPVFNRRDLLTQSWYPLGPAKSLKKNTVRSFEILQQRLVVYRSSKGEVFALDSFCPHMGADLGNGEVVGEKLRCYFHHYTLDSQGHCSHLGPEFKQRVYPICEKYDYLWVYLGEEIDHPVPHPPGLEGQKVRSLHLKKARLYAHHHVMMVGAIDLQHFKSVHKLDIKFHYDVKEMSEDSYCWQLSGLIPTNSWGLKFAAWLTGGEFKYHALFAGGTITTLTYGPELKFRGTGFSLPTINLFWGATPLKAGVSEVDVFCVIPEYKGIFAPLKRTLMFFLSFLVLTALKDDDVLAFPHMRFQLQNPSDKDRSVVDLVERLDRLKVFAKGEK